MHFCSAPPQNCWASMAEENSAPHFAVHRLHRPRKKNPTDTAGPWSTPPPPGPSGGSQPIEAVLSAPPNVISLLILQPTYSSSSHSTFSVPSSSLSILSSSFSSHPSFHPFLHIHSSCLLPPTSSRSLTFLWPPLAARRLSSLRMRCPVSCRPEPSMLPTSLSPVPALLAAFT